MWRWTVQIEKWLSGKQGAVFHHKLEKVSYALDLLGHPEKNLSTIHVAGTNGKGSTIAFLSQLLQGQGFRVGTFVSPHIETVRDRICMNQEPISQADFQTTLAQVHSLEERVARVYEPFSYFETLFLTMLAYFSQQNLDYALIEVGIGGGADVTVLVQPMLTLITSIGLDHQDLLGTSLREIAEQKAGIVKPRVPLLAGPLEEESRAVCYRKAQAADAPFYSYGADFYIEENQFYRKGKVWLSGLELGLEGKHQVENAALALQAFYLLLEKSGQVVQPEAVLTSLQATKWAGRLEQVAQAPAIYLDGAHNLPGIERLLDFIKDEAEGKVTILFSALRRKDFQEMLDRIEERLPEAQLVLTSFAYDGVVEAKDISSSGRYVAEYPAFIREWQAKAEQTDHLFITGSLYFISEVRPLFYKN